MIDTLDPDAAALAQTLHAEGFAFVPAPRLRALLPDSLPDWQAFADSWDELPLDRYMADQGRYRRRRHAVFQLDDQGRARALPAQPHFQALDYNPLNGGIERWYEPVAEVFVAGASLTALLALSARVFGAADPAPAGWFVEVHQFRIEARPGEPGQPTPEGMHRDGVDHVLVLLVRRCNVREGTTLIGDAESQVAGSFTLAEPFDAALVEDRRWRHGVTAVQPVDPAAPAWRDVLVITLRRNPG